MTTEVKTEKKAAEEKEVKRFNPSDYSCQILLENTTLEKADDKSFPSDAYLVWYNVEGNETLDVTRSAKKSNIFDMYYDAYGKDCIKDIGWGRGTIHPGMWGYKNPEKKKRRKG